MSIINFFLQASPLRLGILIAVATLALYAPFLHFPFVHLDDNYLIYDNPAVRQLTPQTLKHVFTTYDPQLYIPLTFVSYQLNALLFGMEPLFFHAANLLLHIGNALLLFWIVRRITGRLFIAFFTALFFAVHPINTEAVLWASARKDTLSAFFFLLSTAAYLLYHEKRARVWYAASVCAFLLALLAKVSAIPLPFVLLLIDWWQGRGWTRQALREKLPYFLLCVVFGIIAVIGKSAVLSSSGSAVIALIPFKSAAFYLWKLFAPWGFSVIYPQTPVLRDALPVLLAGLILTAGLIGSALWSLLRGRFRVLFFGIAWFFLLLLPSFTTSWKNGFLYFASDRYAYLAGIGIFFLVAWLLARLDDRARRPYGSIIGLTAALALIPLAILQSRTWADSATMYRNVLQQYPDSVMALTNLGMELDAAGQKEEAFALYRKATETDPLSTIAHFNLAANAGESGNIAEALRIYRHIVDILRPEELTSPQEFKRFYWLADTFEELGQPDDAERLLRKLTSLAPNDGTAHGRLGAYLERYGRDDDALRELMTASDLGTYDVPSLSALGRLQAKRGDLAEARETFNRVLKMDPDNAEAEEYLAEIRRRL